MFPLLIAYTVFTAQICAVPLSTLGFKSKVSKEVMTLYAWSNNNNIPEGLLKLP